MSQACCHLSLLPQGADGQGADGRGARGGCGRRRWCGGGGAVPRALSELSELIPAVICSVVTTAYVLRAEQAKAQGPNYDDDVRPTQLPRPTYLVRCRPVRLNKDFLRRAPHTPHHYHHLHHRRRSHSPASLTRGSGSASGSPSPSTSRPALDDTR